MIIPKRDDQNWLKHSLAWQKAGEIELKYKPVKITSFQPKEKSLLGGSLCRLRSRFSASILKKIKNLTTRPYKLEADPNDRVLDLLEQVKGFHDGTLSFRRSCAHGMCGSDAIRINGRNYLACKVLLKDLHSKHVRWSRSWG